MGKARRSEIGGIAVVLIFCCFGTVAQGKYSGGSGTEGEPYRISAVSDWQELMATPPDWGSHFVLTADIDLNDVPITPVGNDPNWFTGVFDGNDYVIRNVDVNMPGSDYVGLFGYLGTDGQIRNLGVEDVSIVGGNLVGGLVGFSYFASISNCRSTGSVSGTGSDVGGLVGHNYGNISNSYTAGSVSGDSFVGGLVGSNDYSGTITKCYSTGSISGDSYIGGLVAWNYGIIRECYASRSVISKDYVGGLVGMNDAGLISNCYSTGSVSGDSYVGGLVGFSWYSIVSDCCSTGFVSGNQVVGGLVGKNEDSLISNCHSSGWVIGKDSVGGLVAWNCGDILKSYSTGSVSGDFDVGGLVGYSYYNIVRDCYSTGSVSGVQAVGGLVGGDERHYAISNCYSTSSVSGDLDVGGLVGVNHYSIINDSYWDIETSGEPNMCGSQEDGETNCDPNYGRTTAQMKQQSTFQGWDFINVWDIGENQTYPYLRTVPAGDINKDRIVNFLDLWIVAEEWMREE